MEEIKITREEVVGYRAADGTKFYHKDACEKYERGALCAAKLAANMLQKNAKSLEDVSPIVGCYEENIAVYEIRDAADLQVLNTCLALINPLREEVVDPKYIGQRVAIQFWIDDDDYYVLGNNEDMINQYLKKLSALFSDPEVAS